MESDQKPKEKIQALFDARLKGELASYREALEKLARYLASSCEVQAEGNDAPPKNVCNVAHQAIEQHAREALEWRMFSLLRTIIHICIEHHLDPNIRFSSSDTVLHSLQCPLDVAAMILKEKPESVRAENKRGKTPLHMQVTRKDTEAEAMVALLLQSHAPLHAGDDEGFTPLHYAMRYHIATSKMVRMLLKHGAQNTLTILSERKKKNENKKQSLAKKWIAWLSRLRLNAALQ